MLYIVSKGFWQIAQPAHLWVLLMVIGTVLLFTRRRRLGLGLLSLDSLLILMIALLPVGHWFITPLEARFPRLIEMPIHVDGIIMLGGDADVAFADLARRYPKAKLVFTGAAPVDSDRHSSQWMGIETSRITFVPESRNTFEDVVDAKAIVHPTPTEIWILVTSAFHMPRSVGLFQAQDWRVVPNPVGYEAGAGDVAIPNFDFTQNLTLLSVALKEWIGMFANRLFGHSESFFPGPPSELPRKTSNSLPLAAGLSVEWAAPKRQKVIKKRRNVSRGEFTSHCSDALRWPGLGRGIATSASGT